MPSSSTVRKPLGVRVTAEQHRLLTAAAAREHRSVDNFVLQAALEAAGEPASVSKPTAGETDGRLREAQALFRQSDLYNRDLVAELIQERRAEAARG